MADFRVNQNIVSWPDIVVKCNSKPVKLLCGITYDDKRERTKAYGQGRHYAPIGRTRGKYIPGPLKLTFYKGGAALFRQQLADQAPDKKSYGNVEFEFSVQYIADEGTPIHVQFKRCVYVGTSSSDDESTDPSKDEVEVDTMQILRNGLSLFDSTQGAP